MKKIDPDQEDPRKKTLPDVTVVGVRKKKPVDLPDVTVSGVRKKQEDVDLPAVSVTGNRKKIELPAASSTSAMEAMKKPAEEKLPYTMSDEYKAILWHKDSERQGKGLDVEENPIGRIEKGAPDYNYSEGYYKKKGKEGKMWVRYSDGTIHKLGEKYTPPEHKVKPTSGKAYPGGGKSWLEWYQSRREGKEDDFSERKDAPNKG
jgi:hypothetical protein